MAAPHSDIANANGIRNLARLCVEAQSIAWLFIIVILLWGLFAYLHLPKRKDPDIPVRIAVAICPWDGVPAEKIERLVTRKIEERIAENSKVAKIESITRDSIVLLHIELDERATDTGKEFDDIQLKLSGIHNLPQGAGPITFLKDFGDTAALMLTVASPRVSEIEIELRASAIGHAIEQVRSRSESSSKRTTLLYSFPQSVSPQLIRRPVDLFSRFVESQRIVRDTKIIEGPGFIAVDGVVTSEASLLDASHHFIRERLNASEFHPDSWQPVLIGDLRDIKEKLLSVAAEKYSYRELDDFADKIKRTLQTIPQVSKITRVGILREQIVLAFSQERLASYGVQIGLLSSLLSNRNISMPGGQMEVEGKRVLVNPSGEFQSEQEIKDVLITTGAEVPVYLRDLVDIGRGYESPARYLNFYSWHDANGTWYRSRAVTLAIQMRQGEQIGKFGQVVDEALDRVKARLPEDLILARTSDQPLQVSENVGLFLTTLFEAIVLVVLVALVGFWDWRTALLIATSIPLTLAFTFGLMHLLGLDIQQVSLASLVIALGLLVDVPVVAGDAIKRELAAGHLPVVAAWLGPSRLAKAIFFATLTNIVAYLPFLMLSGDIGRFLFTLPLVMTITLGSAYLFSLTCIPVIGYVLFRTHTADPSLMENHQPGPFSRFYSRLVGSALEHRWAVLGGSLLVLALASAVLTQLKQQFFPKDLSYLSYVDVWLPEDASLAATKEATELAERIIRNVAEESRGEEQSTGRPSDQVLKSLTSFVGGGSPRFWFSVSPELRQLNYGQILIQVRDKHDTQRLIAPLQEALSSRVPGARIDVRQLETGKVVGVPISVRLAGDDIATLRTLATEVKEIFRAIPDAVRIRDNWGGESFFVRMKVDPDRANLAGVSNRDVALATAAATLGVQVTDLREGDRQIPVVARLRMEERAQLSDIQNLYVYSAAGKQKVSLLQVSSLEYGLETSKLQRRNQFRTITVSCFPAAGVLPSQVMSVARPQLMELARRLPAGYTLQVGGEEEQQIKGFQELAIVMGISIGAIFLALVLQFKSLLKPWIVFAAIPYGMVGALLALRLMDLPFGFMAFLGVASLVGVIVSHIIVLFDCIEELREQGRPLRETLIEAGLTRLRPVLVTVGATVFGLIPLASHGGPLWEPLCFAQIGGLTVATFLTLILVPVLYAIAVLDLRVISWEGGIEERSIEPLIKELEEVL